MAAAKFETQEHRRARMYPLAMALGILFAVTFTLCVLFDLWFPSLAMHSAWAPLLPGFSMLTWPSFFLGLVETFAYGWFVAIIFVPLFNIFTAHGQDKGRA